MVINMLSEHDPGSWPCSTSSSGDSYMISCMQLAISNIHNSTKKDQKSSSSHNAHQLLLLVGCIKLPCLLSDLLCLFGQVPGVDILGHNLVHQLLELSRHDGHLVKGFQESGLSISNLQDKKEKHNSLKMIKGATSHQRLKRCFTLSTQVKNADKQHSK